METPVSAAQFEKEALPLLDQEFEQHDKIILVGGSGLFIDALIHGLDDLPSHVNVQQKWAEIAEKKGLKRFKKKSK